jgi:quinol monooxygenase YgiN
MSSLMVSAQVALPAWVKARGLAITQLVFNGALSLGSVLWGVVAEQAGLPWTFVIAAAGLAVSSVVALRWRLATPGAAQFTPSLHWPAPQVAEIPADDQGPVMVMIEYRIDPAKRAAFAEVLERLGHIRRRDGALFWDHFVDTADPTRHVEVFLSESWLEHLRQHERVTVADRAVEDQVKAFHVGTEPPVVTHLVSARE